MSRKYIHVPTKLVNIYITNSEIPFIENDLRVYYETIWNTRYSYLHNQQELDNTIDL